MTRFGVMKHLKVLEAASLVLSHKQGRSKYHYLNAAPLQEVVDTWIDPLVRKPAARALLDLKSRLEGENMMTVDTNEKPDFMMAIYIRTDVNTLWQALTSPELSAKYNTLAGAIIGDFSSGSGPYKHRLQNGDCILSGEILRANPPSLLEMTFVPGWGEGEGSTSRVIYEIETVGATCKLSIRHYGLTAETAGVAEGWQKILSNLKSLLETGKVLDMSANEVVA